LSVPPPSTDVSTLSLHDALPISRAIFSGVCGLSGGMTARTRSAGAPTWRSGLGWASGPGRGMAGWAPAIGGPLAAALAITSSVRSEEHTSELQSRENLVCRLLLE